MQKSTQPYLNHPRESTGTRIKNTQAFGALFYGRETWRVKAKGK
jgi:hypothetical protein